MKLQLEEKKYIIFHNFFPPSKNTKERKCMEALLHYIRYGLIFDRKYIFAARMIQELKNISARSQLPQYSTTIQYKNTIQLNTARPSLFLAKCTTNASILTCTDYGGLIGRNGLYDIPGTECIPNSCTGCDTHSHWEL